MLLKNYRIWDKANDREINYDFISRNEAKLIMCVCLF